MSTPSSLRSELGLSGDQFYRRVRILIDAGLITTERGTKNQILLKDEHAAVLRQFRAIEQNSQEHSLEWCLERLRYELEAARAKKLEESLTFARIEVNQVRMALAKRTRNPFLRFFRAISFRFSRKRPAAT
jgi:hypothetical protein